MVSYGFSRTATWRIADHRHVEGGQEFNVVGPHANIDVALGKPGTHLASNAGGVLAFLSELGYDVGDAGVALQRFSGVRRRYELRGNVSGVTIVDDYAHHPTEVAATISAATQGTTGRVVAVFQPHRYTRTADLGPQFGEPLSLADHVIVTDVYAAGEVPIIGVSGRIVAEASEAAGAETSYVPNLSDVGAVVAELVVPGDTVLLLGAGDITTAAQSVALAIRARP
jgi:UDP-N-acetylmuramate--alanine ligase